MSEGARVGRTVIGKLRLRGADLEPLSARLRLESLLSGAHLVPVGLPPSATVCIRRLMDPKPGVLPVRQHALRPPAAWDEAVVSLLEAQVARAARPALGAVPPGAEAVLFADPSELLACLASDVSRGSALAHWWWRGLFPSVDLARTLVAEWLRQPEYVPAALETAVRRREARPVLALFTEDEARTVLAQVARVHGLTELARVRTVEEEPTRKAEASGAGREVQAEEAPGVVAAEAPWTPWVPEVRTLGLGEAREALLGVAMMLRRAPEETRRPSFAPAVVAWRKGQTRPAEASDLRPRPAPATSTLEVQAVAMDLRIPGAEQSVVTGDSSGPVGAADGGIQVGDGGVAQGSAGADLEMAGGEVPVVVVEDASPAPSSTEAPAAVRDERHEPVGLAVADETPVVAAPPAPPHVASAPPRVFEPPPGRAWGLPIPTGLGGLFYLVNLALFLELYGDFSRPAHPHLPLSLWDFVTLLGRRLLVDPRPGDPVWKVLALLSGRKPGDAPGHAFEPPDAWRVPEEWLHAFRTEETQVWTWSAQGGRLRVLHPAGFVVVDVPREDDDAEAQVQREVEPYLPRPPAPLSRGMAATSAREHAPGGSATAAAEPRFTLASGEVPPPGGAEAAPLERWLAWLVPYSRARLVRALGLTSDDALELEGTLFSHDARLHVSESHVDVVLALSQLPLAVRIAGLDRDIGWLPSAGRHLTFHFE
ncbi:hypothetical protein [Pyxidicoccus caerfyrddinensis]|uniref:hypothetical protein n=1 Tax=Pyxidicoccus caerfyrddinensis TaxID=2709663 RepID=UPI0013DBE538|nr:hypothetical protein [Pyxidicoccus caerfyrddinensis]